MLGNQGEGGETVKMVATGRKRKKDEERGKACAMKRRGKGRDYARNWLVVVKKHGAQGSCWEDERGREGEMRALPILGHMATS